LLANIPLYLILQDICIKCITVQGLLLGSVIPVLVFFGLACGRQVFNPVTHPDIKWILFSRIKITPVGRDLWFLIIHTVGIKITPCGRDRWFPTTSATLCSFIIHILQDGELPICLQQSLQEKLKTFS